MNERDLQQEFAGEVNRVAAADTDAAPADKWIGATIDKYSIVRILGRGGMGAVYEARHAKVSRRFAIKFLLPRHADNADVLRRFENEAKAAGRLEHPNLAAVTDFGRASDGSPYIVMEFLEGKDCATLLREQGPLPLARAANIVAQACRGLSVAHRAGIVHRDLKPENLFMTDAGDGTDLLKVLDFGIAKLRTVDAGTATGTGEMFGTAHYMSPEQARGTGEVDERTDVWSLGVVLYELLSGRKPFQGQQFLDLVYQIQTFEPPPLVGLAPRLPTAVVRIVERAMTKDPARRFPTVLALAEALAPFVMRDGRSGRQIQADALAVTAATPLTGPALPVSGIVAGGVARAKNFPWRTNKVLAGALLVFVVGVAAFFARRFSVTPSATGSGASVANAPAPGVTSSAARPVQRPVAPSAVTPAAAAPRPAASTVGALADEPSSVAANGSRRRSQAPADRSTSRSVAVRARQEQDKDRLLAPATIPNRAHPVEKAATGRPLYIDTDDPLAP